MPVFGHSIDLVFQIANQPLNGLITEFDADSGAVTYLPARGYRGPDRLAFVANDGLTNSPIATMNLTIVSPPDTNGNGLPDAWEVAHGVTDPHADNDGDGLSNLGEYRANTQPTYAGSVLRLLETEREPDGSFHLSWASVGGTRYRVQYLDGDTPGGLKGNFVDVFRLLEDEMDAAPYGEDSAQSFTDTSVPANGSRFYRIRIVP